MSAELVQLAQAAGLVTEWIDFEGQRHEVPAATLCAILEQLELPCATAAACRESHRQLAQEEAAMPALVVGRIGGCCSLPRALAGRPFRLRLEQGGIIDGRLSPDGALQVRAPAGYHRLELGGEDLQLALAPPRCFGIGDCVGERRLWGISAQLYALPRAGDGGIGDFTALAELAVAAAQAGADALAFSPVHALFSAEPERFGPYSPSSRLFLNPLHADPAAVLGVDFVRQTAVRAGLATALAAQEQNELIDWPAAARGKLALLRELYRCLPRAGAWQSRFERFSAVGGEALAAHAAFETLHAHFLEGDPAARDWQNWPGQLHDPRSPAVAEFLRAHSEQQRFHQFLQWLADESLAAAQRSARDAGMAVGLIGDLAVGTDGGGSHAWSCQREMLIGLGVGAPPDALNPHGQNWGLTTFSPRALRRTGYRQYIELLRAALRRVGGLRVDHVLGLQRLWLIPQGAPPTEGAYLRYPSDTLYALLALESWRARAIVAGEDLGTVPQGFREQLEAAGLLGTRLLWFERDHGLFVEPARWPREVVAMSSSHDLPTVAGWWRGRDIDWRARLGLFARDSAGEAAERQQRAGERRALWDALRHSGAAGGEPPAVDGGAALLPAAAAHLAKTPARLALVAAEDLLGVEEQANIPGTTDAHPNWRRRLPVPAARLLQQPQAQASLRALQRERPRP